MITGVTVSENRVVISDKGSAASEILTGQLKLNQTVDAKVLAAFEGKNITLLINGKTLTARTALPFSAGDEISLKVVQDKDSLVLKLIAPLQEMNSSRISSLVSLLSGQMPFKGIEKLSLPASLKTALMEFSLQSYKPDHNLVPKFLDAGGLLLEKKMAQVLKDLPHDFFKQDFKGMLLRQIGLAGAGGEKQGGIMSDFIQTIENFQLLNHQSADSGKTIFPFPVFSNGTFSFGQLLIDTGQADDDGKASKTSDRMTYVSFLLDMSRLGPLRADFSVYGKTMAGIFKLSSQEVCEYMEGLMPELKARLSKSGYQLLQVSCQVAADQEVHPSSLVESVLKRQDARVLNIVV